MTQFRLSEVEFYITNVCNLTCQGCNRFNNHKFSGFQRWNDYKEIYAKWATQLKVDNAIGILGGETLLNPDFMNWATGIRELWSDPALIITTNGYRLNQIDGFYDFVLAHKKNTFVSVGIHNKMSKPMLMDNIKKFLTGPLKYEFRGQNPYHQEIYITDANEVRLRVQYNWWFHQGALIQNPETMKFTLHQSDVEKAHNICHSKYCHHFMNGKLYKCGAVALFPEFGQQHHLELSEEDRALMNAYKPLEFDDADNIKQDFINNIRNSIPQCRFCPEEYHGQQIFAEEKHVVRLREKSK